MRVQLTEPFVGAFKKMPQPVQKLFGKQLGLLLSNFHHPSLRTKIYDSQRRLWQGRVNDSYRFYFTIEGDYLVMHGIGPHPK